MYEVWKKEFLGVVKKYPISMEEENRYGTARISFSPSENLKAKHIKHFVGSFFVVCATVQIFPKKIDNWLSRLLKKDLESRWADKMFSILKDDKKVYDLKRGGDNWIKYELLYLFSHETGQWYLLRVDEGVSYECHLDTTNYDTTHWGSSLYSIPEIGDKTLTLVKNVFVDTAALKEGVSKVIVFDMAEAKQKQKEKLGSPHLKEIKVNLGRHLSGMLVDSSFIADDESNREKLLSLVLNGSLELEGLNLSSLNEQELIEEIAKRIPEDQQPAFRERIKELINAYTNS